MRPIEFRAWHEEDKVMVYDLNSLSLFHGKLGSDDYKLMQFTGLLDKNWNKIFEGDVIYGFYGNESWYGEYEDCIGVDKPDKEYGIIEYGTHDVFDASGSYGSCIATGFHIKHPNGYYQALNNGCYINIVGNLHQNPELLIITE